MHAAEVALGVGGLDSVQLVVAVAHLGHAGPPRQHHKDHVERPIFIVSLGSLLTVDVFYSGHV